MLELWAIRVWRWWRKLLYFVRVVAHRGQISRYLSECMRRYVNIWPHYQHNLGRNPAQLMNIVAGSRLLGPRCQQSSGGSSGRLAMLWCIQSIVWVCLLLVESVHNQFTILPWHYYKLAFKQDLHCWRTFLPVDVLRIYCVPISGGDTPQCTMVNSVYFTTVHCGVSPPDIGTLVRKTFTGKKVRQWRTCLNTSL